jgi:hypothetical protein
MPVVQVLGNVAATTRQRWAKPNPKLFYYYCWDSYYYSDRSVLQTSATAPLWDQASWSLAQSSEAAPSMI